MNGYRLQADKKMQISFLALSKSFSATRGGECLGPVYQGSSSSHFRFRCERDHVWTSDAKTVLNGAWCPRCKRVERHFAEVKKIISAKGGKILGPFKNSRIPLLVECEHGHRWGARSPGLVKGSWCARCAFDRASHTLEKMKQVAKERGGSCLSESYRGVGVKLEWKCREGHAWLSTPNAILGGRWCPKCAGVKPLSIEEMRALANERGGECLSQEYVNGRSKLHWRCGKGHEWSAVPSNVVQGAWCPVCAFDFVRFTLEDVQRIARDRGGKCLVEEYTNGREMIPWQCEEGHVWKARARTVSRGTWCPRCANSNRKPLLKIETLQAYAAAKGGRLLSPEVKKAHESLAWRCAAGHAWLMSWAKLRRNGRWCRQCARRARSR